MIIKRSIKGNNTLCDCCHKRFTDKIMKVYELGPFKIFIVCKDCETQLNNVSNVDSVGKVISVDNNIYY